MPNERAAATGPFNTLAEARSGMALGRQRGSDTLVMACAEAGVTLGRYDARVLDELTQLDAESVWVVASIIRRAGGGFW